LWANIDDIFRFLPKGETYSEGKYVVLLIGPVKLFDIGTGLNTEIILYSRYFRWATILIISAALISVALSLVLIPAFGYTRAAFAAVIPTLVLSAAKLLLVRIKFGIQPFSGTTAKLIVLFAGTYLLALAFPPSPEEPIPALLLIAAKSAALA